MLFLRREKDRIWATKLVKNTVEITVLTKNTIYYYFSIFKKRLYNNKNSKTVKKFKNKLGLFCGLELKKQKYAYYIYIVEAIIRH